MKDRNGNRDQFARTFHNAGRFDGGGLPTDRHPSDLTWTDCALWIVIAIGIGCAIAGITVWAPAGGTF